MPAPDVARSLHCEPRLFLQRRRQLGIITTWPVVSPRPETRPDMSPKPEATVRVGSDAIWSSLAYLLELPLRNWCVSLLHPLTKLAERHVLRVSTIKMQNRQGQVPSIGLVRAQLRLLLSVVRLAWGALQVIHFPDSIGVPPHIAMQVPTGLGRKPMQGHTRWQLSMSTNGHAGSCSKSVTLKGRALPP